MPEHKSDMEEKTITLHELIERSARAALELQREDGSFPPGNNNPYQDNATPVRNTSNWLKILSFVYNLTSERKFRQASNAAINYLQRDNLRPYGYTYKCRKCDKKDSCNGLVGQANVIEAMVRAGDYLDRPELYDYAAQIYSLHPFNEHIGVWNRVEIDGTVLTIDRTFNHQLIFATASALLAERIERDTIENEVSVFLDNLPQNMSWNSKGVIIHRLRPEFDINIIAPAFLDHSIELLLNPILHAKRQILPEEETKMKELAYQSVNLYWMACLKNRTPEQKVWSRLPLQTFLSVTRTQRYRGLAEQRAEWFSNMPPGFEIAHAINTFDKHSDDKEMIYWIEIALKNHYDKESDSFTKNCTDPDTLSGLLYKLLDLPNLTISI